ncbi:MULTISPECIES: hypothetical protein [unclassified Streptomyces]|uniref:hypothetical protein n=1 Tax=unclassified Streptomyces TaxID=2593676 RepID=UPI00381CB7AA
MKKNTRTRLPALTAVAGLAGSLLIVLPSAGAADAAPLICEPGTRSVKWISTSRTQVLTHSVESYKGGRDTVSRTLDHVRTIKAGHNVTQGNGDGYSTRKVLTSLDAQVDGAYTQTKSKTTTKNASIKITVSQSGRYYFYRGTVKATGTWQGSSCDRGSRWVVDAHGTAQTFGAEVEGVLRCGESIDGKSLGRLVQRTHC